MGTRGDKPDHDATMEMSTSQLVPDQPDHDASVWRQEVVGSDAFAPAPKAKPKPVAIATPERAPEPATTGGRTAMWIFIAFVLFTAIAAAAVIALT
jgi:hypothetical protein